jgi:hypothetical protein
MPTLAAFSRPSVLNHYSQETRLIRLSTPLGEDVLVPECVRGEEAIGRDFSFQISALSTNADIGLRSLIGQPALLQLLTAADDDQLRPFVELMKKTGDKPVVVALWDAVGITHELAGFCHDVLGWTDKYSHERELELGAMNAIEGLKKALPEKAVASELDHRAAAYGPTALEHDQETSRNARRRAKAAQMPEPRRSQTLEVCDILDEWASRGLKQTTFESELELSNSLSEP